MLDVISESYGDEQGAFRCQLSNSRVIDRINTVVGFYTRISVDQSAAPAVDRATGGVQTELTHAKHGLVFLLSFEDGYLEQIEGALNYSGCCEPDEDSFAGVDLSTLQLGAVIFDDGTRIEVPA